MVHLFDGERVTWMGTGIFRICPFCPTPVRCLMSVVRIRVCFPCQNTRSSCFLSSVYEARDPDVNGALGNFVIVRCCFVCFSSQMDGNTSLSSLFIILFMYLNEPFFPQALLFSVNNHPYAFIVCRNSLVVASPVHCTLLFAVSFCICFDRF
jgi:hypothetical protein